jgi:hypothetical protein
LLLKKTTATTIIFFPLFCCKKNDGNCHLLLSFLYYEKGDNKGVVTFFLLSFF